MDEPGSPAFIPVYPHVHPILPCEGSNRGGLELGQGLAAIPLYCVCHWGMQGLQIGTCTPSDVVMFGSGQSELARFGTSPVYHADVLMGVRNLVNVQKSWRDQRTGSRAGGWGTFPHQFYLETAFLTRFPQRGLLWIFVQFHMSADREPAIEFAMMNDQDPSVVDDENGDCKVDQLVDVGHVNSRRGRCRVDSLPFRPCLVRLHHLHPLGRPGYHPCLLRFFQGLHRPQAV